MGTGKYNTTVTLDGRLLLRQGLNIIELPDAQTTAAIIGELTAGMQTQVAINGEEVPEVQLPEIAT